MFDRDNDRARSALPLVLVALVLVGGVVTVLLSGALRETSLSDGDRASAPAGTGHAGHVSEVIEHGDGRAERAAIGSAPASPRGAPLQIELRGRVVDARAAPVGGAEVFLSIRRRFGGFRLNTLPVGRDGAAAAARAEVTDADGRFTSRREAFHGALVEVQVFHPEHARSFDHRDLPEIDGEIVELGDFEMEAGLGVRGQVTDLAGSGVSGAKVLLVPETAGGLVPPQIRDRLEPEVTADRTGAFRFAHVRPGAYRLHAAAPGFQAGASGVLELKGHGDIDAGEIRLEPGFRVTGQVTARDGSPIAGAHVELRRTDPPATGQRTDGAPAPYQGGLRGGHQVGARARSHRARPREFFAATDRNGKFVIDGLPAAPMSLRITADGFLDYRQAEVAPHASPHVQARLGAGLEVAGVVADAVTKTPITEFAVQAHRVSDLPERAKNVDRLARRAEVLRELFRNGPPRIPQIDAHASGRFRLSGLRQGVYVFDVLSRTHQRYRSQSIELRAGTPVPELRFELATGR